MAAALSLYYEYRMRGDKFAKEIDLALINTLGMAVATGATTWLVAPSRSYGSIHKFPWQQVRDQRKVSGMFCMALLPPIGDCNFPPPCLVILCCAQ